MLERSSLLEEEALLIGAPPKDPSQKHAHKGNKDAKIWLNRLDRLKIQLFLQIRFDLILRLKRQLFSH